LRDEFGESIDITLAEEVIRAFEEGSDWRTLAPVTKDAMSAGG